MKETGHLQIKVTGYVGIARGKWHMYLRSFDEYGNENRFSRSTGLPERGNKKRAEAMLNNVKRQTREELRNSVAVGFSGDRILFADYIEQRWLPVIRATVQPTTYSGYVDNVRGVIAPYFRKKKIILQNMTAEDVDDFLQEQLATKKLASVKRYLTNIRKAVTLAKSEDKLIPTNFMPDVKKLIKPESEEEFEPKFLSEAEAIAVMNAARGHRLELPILIGTFYGLRRSEVCGLRWSAINFDTNTITINHTVTTTRGDDYVKEDGTIVRKKVLIARNRGKSKKSLRSLPLIPELRVKLLEAKAQQDHQRQICGNCYHNEHSDYVYVDALGIRYSPDYITRNFPDFMVANGFERIRFHDLRHTSGSLLVARGVPMKLVQKWLGHSDFNVTANTYAHLDTSVTRIAAQSMDWIGKTQLGAESATWLHNDGDTATAEAYEHQDGAAE